MKPAISNIHQGISFGICYITFKTRISFKEHMKGGTHLLAPGPAGVKGRFLREIMLLLDGFSVGGQSTRDIGFTPVMSVTKLSSLCNYLASTKFGITLAMCLPARVVIPTTASTETISLCVASLAAGRVFATSPCGHSSFLSQRSESNQPRV